MKKQVIVLSLWAAAAMSSEAAFAAQDFKNDVQRESYAIGANVIRQMRQRETRFDVDFVIKGIRDQKAGKSKMTAAEIDMVMQKLRSDAQKRADEKLKAEGEKSRKKGEEFLAANAKKEGVAVLPGGVQYSRLKEGTGALPLSDDVVVVVYRGTLLDGTEFESSSGKPKTLKMRKMIDGLKEGLTQMPVGSKWKLYIPAHKAYGEKGFAPTIGPNETVIFEVELLEIIS